MYMRYKDIKMKPLFRVSSCLSGVHQRVWKRETSMTTKALLKRSTDEETEEKVEQRSSPVKLIKLDHAILYTGGATGADTLFATTAVAKGHRVVIKSFRGHRVNSSKECHIEYLQESQYAECDRLLKDACIALKRYIPWKNGPYVVNLLRCGVLQARNVERVYAVSDFEEANASKDKFDAFRGSESVGVLRGTAWACQVFAMQFKDQEGPIELYLFSQSRKSWWQCHCVAQRFFWRQIEAPPPPTGYYAGIGTRDLLPVGAESIRALYR